MSGIWKQLLNVFLPPRCLKCGRIVESGAALCPDCFNEMHFISGNPWEGVEGAVDIMFKNRHSPEFIKARLTHLGGLEYVIESEKKVQGIAPGQFAVIYSPDAHLCYGSGIITGQKMKKDD